MALATQAARSLGKDLVARAHLVASRAAHLTDRRQLAEEHADVALDLANTQETREGALWLRFTVGFPVEAADLRDRLDEFRRTARPGIRQSLHLAAAGLSLAELEGNVGQAIDNARSALSIADEKADPYALTGLLNTYSYALISTCRYEESLKQIDALLQIAESCGLEFPVPYAHAHKARALTGLGKFAPAARAIASIERHMQDEPCSYFRGCIPVERARLYASVGDLQRALEALTLGPHEGLNRSGRGEFLAWQALFHAVARDLDQARALAVDSRLASRSVEAEALQLLAEGIIALTERDTASAAARLRAVKDNEVWDPAVIAVRAAPQLGEFMAGQPELRSWLQGVLAASSDTSLARRLGIRIPRAAKRAGDLSARESEVHELLAQGLTNEEIAKQLYISLSTTKVHVKHIYEKLGVRSRLEAARALRDDV